MQSRHLIDKRAYVYRDLDARSRHTKKRAKNCQLCSKTNYSIMIINNNSNSNNNNDDVLLTYIAQLSM